MHFRTMSCPPLCPPGKSRFPWLFVAVSGRHVYNQAGNRDVVGFLKTHPSDEERLMRLAVTAALIRQGIDRPRWKRGICPYTLSQAKPRASDTEDREKEAS